VVILLVLSVSINYIDRGNLSIAAPLLKDELGISASQLGILLSSFFWTYAACQILAGWLVDRFAVNWVLAVGFFLWSMATASTGLVHGFATLLCLRLLLGIGESVAYPCYSKILAAHFHEHQRGLPKCPDRRRHQSRTGDWHAGGRHPSWRASAGGRSLSPWDWAACSGCRAG